MDRGTILWIILGMAVVQIVVHLKYFLHMDGSRVSAGTSWRSCSRC